MVSLIRMNKNEGKKKPYIEIREKTGQTVRAKTAINKKQMY